MLWFKFFVFHEDDMSVCWLRGWFISQIYFVFSSPFMSDHPPPSLIGLEHVLKVLPIATYRFDLLAFRRLSATLFLCANLVKRRVSLAILVRFKLNVPRYIHQFSIGKINTNFFSVFPNQWRTFAKIWHNILPSLIFSLLNVLRIPCWPQLLHGSDSLAPDWKVCILRFPPYQQDNLGQQLEPGIR